MVSSVTVYTLINKMAAAAWHFRSACEEDLY